jgi:hypothetical protein
MEGRTMVLESLNWIAVIVSAVVYFVLGALWYSPMLFANQFMKYRGLTKEQIQSEGSGNPVEYLFVLVINLILALVVAIVVRLAGAATLVDGAAVGLMLALGIAAVSTLTYTIFSGPHRALWVIYTGYQALGLVIMGVILALWR